MPENKYPWRKQVQALLEEYALPIRGYVSPLTPEQRNAIWHAIQNLPYEYQKVVNVLDCKDERISWLHPDAFPKGPRSLRQGLTKILNVSLRTVDDWHATALDEIANSLGLTERDAVRPMPKPRSPEDKERKRIEAEIKRNQFRPSWWDSVEERLTRIGRYGFFITKQEYEHEVQLAIRWSKKTSFIMSPQGDIPLDNRLILPPNPKEQREKARMVLETLTNKRSRILIMDRYWDREFNQRQHPNIPVRVYAED